MLKQKCTGLVERLGHLEPQINVYVRSIRRKVIESEGK